MAPEARAEGRRGLQEGRGVRLTSTASLFDPKAFVEEQVAAIRKSVHGHAIIGLSGGVDSAVAAAIAGRALGNELTAVYVDTGFMRQGETEHVRALLSSLGADGRVVDAKEEFMAALAGVVDPEEKRRIIGEKFIRVFERVAKEADARYLVQGTIAPDWIESGGGVRDTIKTHHNVGGLPKDLKLELVEPLRDLYKDEVRKVARELKLPVSERQPFPGPGLAVRCLGECTPERVEIVRGACAIVEEEIEKAHQTRKIRELPWQYFAALLPVKSVGVQGDIRVYGETVVVRAVQSVDAMTAMSYPVPFEVLQVIGRRILNAYKDKVNRVVYDLSDKPPGTIEWE